MVVIFRYTKKNLGRSDSKALHRRQLLSVIIYATTPNVLVVIYIVVNVLNVMISRIPKEDKIDTHPWIVLGGMMNKINRYAGYVKIPVLTISTFVAFTSYRRRFLQIAFRRKTMIQVISAANPARTSQTWTQQI
ncbi:hypothetical protein L596_013444 [Steinernema carpocapsae]|uniref:G-protein coupled receptors family 1 profile domain-containing protein n=1 Tax=Steinernema carpocapsae TaxID=34508 RepID=A0A4U5P081_STECR|nr:hypothetical protein L596_013444 [Steinernema carpocapsae]